MLTVSPALALSAALKAQTARAMRLQLDTYAPELLELARAAALDCAESCSVCMLACGMHAVAHAAIALHGCTSSADVTIVILVGCMRTTHTAGRRLELWLQPRVFTKSCAALAMDCAACLWRYTLHAQSVLCALRASAKLRSLDDAAPMLARL